MIAVSGEVNLDFADVKTIMSNQGSALMGIGVASGENRAMEAAKKAISSPLLETSIVGAQGVLMNITGGESLSLFEAQEAANIVQDAADEDVNMIFGTVINPELQDEIVVTVIATGFIEKTSARSVKPQTSSFNQNPVREMKEERQDTSVQQQQTPSSNDGDLDVPSFLRDRTRSRRSRR